MSRVDLWDVSELMKQWCAPAEESEPEVVTEVNEDTKTEGVEVEPVAEENVVVNIPDGELFVVELGVNSRGAMQYIGAFYDDKESVFVTTCPLPTDYSTCQQIVERFKVLQEERRRNATVRRPATNYTYNIVPYKDKYSDLYRTEEENIHRGQEMIAEYRASKKKE